MSMTTEDISSGLNCTDLHNPPDQDSPKNIINILNDFCIQSILRNLSSLSDFVNAANVCMKFRNNAKGCFALMFKTIDIYDNPSLNFETWKTHNNPKLSIQQQQSLLKHFGHLIFDIRMCLSERGDYDSNLFKSVVQFCGQNLIEFELNLTLKYAYVSLPITNFESQFPSLKVIILRDGLIEAEKLVFSSALEELGLSIRTQSLKPFIQSYPKLLRFEFRSRADTTCIEKEDAKHPFIKFLELNPQIVYLDVSNTLYGQEGAEYDEITLKDIHDRLPNLKLLECDHLRSFESHSPIFPKLKFICVRDIENSDLIWLSKNMTNLVRIRIGVNYDFNLETYIKVLTLATNLKRLYLDDLTINAENYHSILRSIQMRTKPCFVRVENIDDVPSDIIDANSKYINTVHK